MNAGLMKKLATDAKTGIIGDSQDLERRMKSFGVNERSLPALRSFWTIMKGHLDDTLVYLLLIFAAISFVGSFWSEVQYAWLEGMSIVVAVAFMTSLSAICDYGKEQQFNRLRKELMKEKSKVIRG